tara:strand:+ start:245 stop:517 length:273 start_codon:yes stop_codon:yes gene_type:complete
MLRNTLQTFADAIKENKKNIEELKGGTEVSSDISNIKHQIQVLTDKIEYLYRNVNESMENEDDNKGLEINIEPTNETDNLDQKINEILGE